MGGGTGQMEDKREWNEHFRMKIFSRWWLGRNTKTHESRDLHRLRLSLLTLLTETWKFETDHQRSLWQLAPRMRKQQVRQWRAICWPRTRDLTAEVRRLLLADKRAAINVGY
jgi:hypothetical protein